MEAPCKVNQGHTFFAFQRESKPDVKKLNSLYDYDWLVQ